MLIRTTHQTLLNLQRRSTQLALGLAMLSTTASGYPVDLGNYDEGSFHLQPLRRVLVSYVFVPAGFDDRSESQVVLDGFLPSGCYRLMQPKVEVDRVKKQIRITPLVRFFDHPCVEALIPYQLDVNLGVLPRGTFEVLVDRNEDIKSPPHKTVLTVAPADQSEDKREFYAPVDSVQIHKDARGRMLATIEGRLTNTCMQWSNLTLQNNQQTLNLLPVITMASPPPEGCQSTEAYYQKSVYLPSTLKPGRHLLHVRSLNGKALNQLFYIRAW